MGASLFTLRTAPPDDVEQLIGMMCSLAEFEGYLDCFRCSKLPAARRGNRSAAEAPAWAARIRAMWPARFPGPGALELPAILLGCLTRVEGDPQVLRQELVGNAQLEPIRALDDGSHSPRIVCAAAIAMLDLNRRMADIDAL